MGTEIFFIAVIVLMLAAISDLVVGVANDAVNFLNSAIGSRAAPYYIIMLVASLGIIAGVTFSSGMMEVARKGIFHPQFFTMPELMMIFMGVMLTDILLLDLFNTYGLPTSTTVSVVFELLGAAVAISVAKIIHAEGVALTLGEYINTGKAMLIILGILLSIMVAFFFGATVQFITRLIFTFDYQTRLKRYGALWGGVAISFITFFILVEGAEGASFMSPEMVDWINTHSGTLLLAIFLVSTAVFQILIAVFHVNILKPIVLVGTFALAMAFAANDLVNFIGVPLAGLYAYRAAIVADDPLTATMGALAQKIEPNTGLLLVAGVIMVLTLWLSRKARTVTETEISLGRQEEGMERFESIWLSRVIMQMADSLNATVIKLVPVNIREFISRRIDPCMEVPAVNSGKKASFDLVRASVNLMVASALVSFATSLKLPLSTTYVTFMVAMGSSFSDRAWGRETAVFRITGVLVVVAGWFMTALIAFSIAYLFANVIYYFHAPGAVALMLIGGYVIWKNHQKHKIHVEQKKTARVITLENVCDPYQAISETFEHLAFLLKEIRESMDSTFDALFAGNAVELGKQRRRVREIQLWTNIIMANVFKVLRLLQKKDAKVSYKYAQIIRRLQKLSDGHRDTTIRSYIHISNKHRGLLESQVDELKQIKICILDILLKVEISFQSKQILDYANIIDLYQHMRTLADQFNRNQIERIRSDRSKTRLSILYYAIVGNCLMMAKQNIKLFEIFNESFSFDTRLQTGYAKIDSH